MPERHRLWLLPELGSRSLHDTAQSQVLVRPPHDHRRSTTSTAVISAHTIVIASTSN